MSYDLAVYAAEALSLEQLTDLVAASPGLGVDTSVSPGGQAPWFVPITRGKRAGYCFTVEGPYVVEPEDVPGDVTAVALGAGFLFNVLVEGSSDTSVPHAVRFARRLAKESGGVAVDLRTKETWPKASTRKAPRPERDERIEMVEARFYFLIDEAPKDLLERHLAISRRHLPKRCRCASGTTNRSKGNLPGTATRASSTCSTTTSPAPVSSPRAPSLSMARITRARSVRTGGMTVRSARATSRSFRFRACQRPRRPSLAAGLPQVLHRPRRRNTVLLR